METYYLSNWSQTSSVHWLIIKRMHSIRMRTARSLTVSFGIRLGESSLPTPPDADLPACRPPRQTPLDADPLDTDPLEADPLGRPPLGRPPWADPTLADPHGITLWQTPLGQTLPGCRPPRQTSAGGNNQFINI